MLNGLNMLPNHAAGILKHFYSAAKETNKKIIVDLICYGEKVNYYIIQMHTTVFEQRENAILMKTLSNRWVQDKSMKGYKFMKVNT